MYFIDGAMFYLLSKAYDVSQRKYPQVEFPSGETFPIWEGSTSPIIHIFGEMDLPYYTNQDDALELANDIAQQCGYAVRRVDEDKIEVWGHDDDEHYLITVDTQANCLLDIALVEAGEQERPTLPAYDYLPEALLAVLPKLGATEELGMLAVALLKYFTPDAGWTWYATEFDGDDTFFGLVSGLEIELGYFSLAELKQVRGSLGLPIERDLHFEPTTLAELKKWHEDNR